MKRVLLLAAFMVSGMTFAGDAKTATDIKNAANQAIVAAREMREQKIAEIKQNVKARNERDAQISAVREETNEKIADIREKRDADVALTKRPVSASVPFKK